MRLASIAIVVAAFAAPAYADGDAPADPPADQPFIDRAKDFYTRGDFEHAREQLLAAYERAQRPAVLFALGQVEFNLKHYREAIDYYERFAATNPDAAQAALADQAIGAARMAIAHPEPPPTPPPTPMHREFDALDSGLTIGGCVAIAASGVAFYELYALPRDRSGTWSQYDHRVSQASTARILGIASAAVGVGAIVAGLVRWRTHWTPVVRATQGGTSIGVERPL